MCMCVFVYMCVRQDSIHAHLCSHAMTAPRCMMCPIMGLQPTTHMAAMRSCRDNVLHHQQEDPRGHETWQLKCGRQGVSPLCMNRARAPAAFSADSSCPLESAVCGTSCCATPEQKTLHSLYVSWWATLSLAHTNLQRLGATAALYRPSGH